MLVLRHLRKKEKECCITIGNFDGIHLGHQKLIDKVIYQSKKNNLQSALLTFEPHPKEFFFPNDPPERIISLRDKLEFFGDKGIERVHILKFDKYLANLSPNEFLKMLKEKLFVKTIVLGKDFRFGKDRIGNLKDLENGGLELIIAPDFFLKNKKVSSTRVREALSKANFIEVKRLLGRPFVISGKVTHGDKRGREIGFPTANIHMFHDRPPLRGVFAVKLDDFNGIANLGTRPTIGGAEKLNLEVHVFNFSKDIYGKHVHVTFLQKIRDEKKFKTIGELRQQIILDVDKAESFFKHE
jgi:riboflavin kinase/FMN adenylyltransferase